MPRKLLVLRSTPRGSLQVQLAGNRSRGERSSLPPRSTHRTPSFGHVHLQATTSTIHSLSPSLPSWTQPSSSSHSRHGRRCSAGRSRREGLPVHGLPDLGRPRLLRPILPQRWIRLRCSNEWHCTLAPGMRKLKRVQPTRRQSHLFRA